LLAGNERQPVRSIPTEKGAADEDVIVVEAVLKRLVVAVVLLTGDQLDAAKKIGAQLEVGVQAQPESITRALIRIRAAIFIVAGAGRIDLVIFVVVLIP
jgi:hypothetical protein